MTTRKNKKSKKSKTMKKKHVFTKEDYDAQEGMMTNIWGASFWFVLHTLSFNYPVNPTEADKKHYMDFILSLKYILPCKYCRMNLIKNMKEHPITMKKMESRESFSRYIYELHEIVNKMLGKKSGLTYEDVRERFENFRSRCTKDDKPKVKIHKGCVIPLYGKKAKCVLKIIPFDEKVETLQIDEKCVKSRVPIAD